MATCTKCGKELKDAAQFCKACGSGRQEASSNDEKKQRVLAAEKRSFKTPVLAGVAVIAAVAIFFAVSAGKGDGRGMAGGRGEVIKPAATPVTAENGFVKVPAALQAGESKYYVYAGNGKEIRFFLLRASDGTVRVALDACNACYRAKLGYHQQGDAMICNNCGMSFRSSDIGIVKGGCNPIPLENRTEGGAVVVKAQDLEAGGKFF